MNLFYPSPSFSLFGIFCYRICMQQNSVKNEILKQQKGQGGIKELLSINQNKICGVIRKKHDELKQYKIPCHMDHDAQFMIIRTSVSDYYFHIKLIMTEQKRLFRNILTMKIWQLSASCGYIKTLAETL